MHDIPNVEVARHKAKAKKHKLEGIKTRGDNNYRQEKETQCRYCGNNWSPGHQCHKPQSYAYEVENRSKMYNRQFNNRKKKKNTCPPCSDDWIPNHKCRDRQTVHCKIINGKEVQVSAEEISSLIPTQNQSEERHQKNQALRKKLS